MLSYAAHAILFHISSFFRKAVLQKQVLTYSPSVKEKQEINFNWQVFFIINKKFFIEFLGSQLKKLSTYLCQ